MNGLKTKALSIGLSGVAASLLMSGQANAAACPADAALSVLAVPGFSCTVADMVFSGFSFTTNLATHALFGVSPTTGDVTVTFSRDGRFYPNGANTFDYTVTIEPSAPPGTSITMHTLGVDVSTVVPVLTTNDSFMGNNSGSHLLSVNNGGTLALTLSPPDTTETIMLTSTQTGRAQLNSISNDFEQNVFISVPEPASLSLFGLGLLGLGFARRRHS